MIDKQAYSEMYATLLALGEGYISRIPQDVFEFIKSNSDESLMPKIDETKGFDEQGFSKDTIAMIAWLRLEFLCDSEEEKGELLDYLQTNKEKLKEVLMKTTSARELLKLLHKKG